MFQSRNPGGIQGLRDYKILNPESRDWDNQPVLHYLRANKTQQ